MEWLRVPSPGLGTLTHLPRSLDSSTCRRSELGPRVQPSMVRAIDMGLTGGYMKQCRKEKCLCLPRELVVCGQTQAAIIV